MPHEGPFDADVLDMGAEMGYLPSGEPDPSYGSNNPAPPPLTPAEILAKYNAGTLSWDAALADLMATGMTRAIAETTLGPRPVLAADPAAAAAAGAAKAAADKAAADAAAAAAKGKGGVVSPDDPNQTKRLFQLLAQQDPLGAFRQFMRALGTTPAVTRYHEQGAEEGFLLAPFLQPEKFTTEALAARGFATDPIGALGKFTMQDFLGADPFGAIPTPSTIRMGLGMASRPLPEQTTEGRRAVAQALQDPTANKDIFDMIIEPIIQQSGGLFGPIIQRYLQAEQAKWQEANPSINILNALRAGTGPQSFTNLGGWGF